MKAATLFMRVRGTRFSPPGIFLFGFKLRLYWLPRCDWGWRKAYGLRVVGPLRVHWGW